MVIWFPVRESESITVVDKTINLLYDVICSEEMYITLYLSRQQENTEKVFSQQLQQTAWRLLSEITRSRGNEKASSYVFLLYCVYFSITILSQWSGAGSTKFRRRVDLTENNIVYQVIKARQGKANWTSLHVAWQTPTYNNLTKTNRKPNGSNEGIKCKCTGGQLVSVQMEIRRN